MLTWYPCTVINEEIRDNGAFYDFMQEAVRTKLSHLLLT